MYSTTIKKLAPGYDPRHVEAWMRLENGTLGGLSPDHFKSEVKIATMCVDAAPERSEKLAKSYGL